MEENDKNKDNWEQNNTKVVTWILNSIDTPISLSLQAF